MSHQASFYGEANSAVELALAAGDLARRAGLPRVRAEAAVMKADGLGMQGDAKGCFAALHRAEHFFSEVNRKELPGWLSYFDEAYLAAKFAHALRKIGESVEAERFARRSLVMSDGYDRGKLFNTVLLAGALADQKRTEEATVYAAEAIAMGEGIRSARVSRYLSEVCRQIANALTLYMSSRAAISPS